MTHPLNNKPYYVNELQLGKIIYRFLFVFHYSKGTVQRYLGAWG